MYTVLGIEHILTHAVPLNSPEVTLLFSFYVWKQFVCLEHKIYVKRKYCVPGRCCVLILLRNYVTSVEECEHA